MVRSRNNRLQRKISIIILKDCLCWVPFVIICFFHTIGQIDASPWYALLSILILPVNSVINPLLYDDTVERIIERIFRWIRREVDRREIAQRFRIFRGHRETNIRNDVAKEQGHTPPVLPGIAREPGHTPPVLPDVAREPGHTPPVLPDIARESGHTPPVLPDIAREQGHTPPILPDVAREQGHTPPVLPDIAREPGHTPPVLPDVARESGHTMWVNFAETLV